MDLYLKGKSALVTGSTAGIGWTIAQQLLEEGARVVINGRTQDRIDTAIDRLRAVVPEANVSGLPADFSDAAAVQNLLNALPDVDILVNNVGIFAPKSYQDLTDADWYHLFEVNVMSGVRLSRAYLPGMLTRNWGRIVFISSESGVQIPAEMIHYGMTKTAQLAVARGLAACTAGSAVTVNAVLPGSTRSEGAERFLNDLATSRGMSLAEVERDFFANVRPSSLLQRFASPDEVAHMVTYLCSPRASATNGAALRVDGGTIPTIL